MLAAETAGYWLSDLLLRVTGLSDAVLQNDDRVFRIANTLPPLLFVTVAWVLGPFVEELFFRQLLVEIIESPSPRPADERPGPDRISAAAGECR